MKITLLHPTRGRAQQAFDNYQNWLGKASGNHQIEHWLSVDEDDLQLKQYRRLFAGVTNMAISDNDCVVKATNHVAKFANGDVLIYLSDDFDCQQHWDEEIVKAVPDGKPKFMIWVNDGIQGKNSVLTIPMMSGTLYESLGNK